MSIKTIVLSLLLVSFISCSTGYHIPESVEEKMARYESRHQNINLVPEFKIVPFKSLSSRRPASNQFNRDFTRGYSNKRLYFLTLYTQYNELLGHFDSKAPKIKICPGFNTSMQKDVEQFPAFASNKLTIDALLQPDKRQHYSDIQLASHPELSLPVVKNDTHPTVADIAISTPENAAKVLKEAIDIHIAKTYAELVELCQTGSSDNYYTFENLYSHIKSGNEFSPTTENIQVLYKTTLFTNQSLLLSLKKFINGRVVASTNPREIYINELISRFEVNWFQNYLHNISKK